MATRRAFLAALAVAATPRVSGGQPPDRMRRVGFLSGTTVADLVEALRHGLRERGWVEGRQLTLESRSAEGRFERIPELAADLGRRGVEAIVVSATAIGQLKAATAHVPVVFVIADDPVAAGYAGSLARPGGRMTGLTSLNTELDGKRLEILRAALPGLTRVGVLSTRHDLARGDRVAATERAARALGVHVTVHDVPRVELLAHGLGAASRARAGAVMLLGSPVFRAWQGEVATLAQRRRMPVASAWHELPDAGGLMGYGTSVAAMFRRAAHYVDRILNGATPGELPVEQATEFELVVNMKAARALGLAIAPSVVLRADRLIE